MNKPTIVVVDNQRENLDLVASALDHGQYNVHKYPTAMLALQNMEVHGADILLTDLHLPGLDGFALLDIVRQRWPQCKIIIFTAYGGVEQAVRAIKSGATDFLTKPLNQASIPEMVRQLLELRVHTDGAAPAETAPPMEADLHMPNVVELANKAAPTDCTVLVTGESGVGKEVLADYITKKSQRCNEPYVKVDCAAITETLVESELFGHERGAFTGANKRHVGRVERANKGTLFLDEIGELSLTMQTKLLRVLQTHEIERVGGSGAVKVDFRLICATHRDLRKMVSEGRFRQDLFFRINTFPIQIPPLRDRRDEIPSLARMFLARYRTMLQRGPTDISPETMAMLQSYPWPGNVRELEHCLERACLLAPQSFLLPGDVWWLGLPVTHAAPASSAPNIPSVKLPVAAPVPSPEAPAPELTPLEKAEFLALKQTLDKYNWNFTRAAQALGISRSTLYLKASKYDLNRAEAV